MWFINGIFQSKLKFSKFSDGVHHVPGGGSNFFLGWGFQMLISIETHRSCDFSGGGSLSPLWIREMFAVLANYISVPVRLICE